MPINDDLMVGLFSPIPGCVCFSKGGTEIKDAELLGVGQIEPREAGKVIETSEDRGILIRIAPLGANGYVAYKSGLIEFYHIPEKELNEFMARIGLD